MVRVTLINEKHELVFGGTQMGDWFVLVWERDYAYDDYPLIRCDNITREEMFAVADEYGLGEPMRLELAAMDAGLDEVGLP